MSTPPACRLKESPDPSLESKDYESEQHYVLRHMIAAPRAHLTTAERSAVVTAPVQTAAGYAMSSEPSDACAS